MHELAQPFYNIFEGYTEAHGASTPSGKVSSAGKSEAKNVTKREKVTLEKWGNHLIGKTGLGIIPINEMNKVKFAAIDVDDYAAVPTAINDKIVRNNMPLVMTRSKSGGIHLWLFMYQWTEAAIVQEKLLEMAAFLGYADSEIFPKQTAVLIERGDLGSWINMPYFGGDKTDRYGYDETNVVPMKMREFIKHCTEKMCTEDRLRRLSFEVEDLLSGGPPCLNKLVADGFPQGTRNNGLFNLGIYAKKAFPDDWRVKLAELNDRYMKPPLSPLEVVGAIKSLERKDYSYTCKQQPISSVCNAAKCRTCKFGVGARELGMPKLGSLTKVMTEPPVWFIEIEGGKRMELTTEELQSSVLFQKRCLAVLNMMPAVAKRDEWQGIVQKLLDKVNIVEMAEEFTPRGTLLYYLEEFCNSRVSGKSPEELVLGKPYTDGGLTYFKMMDFYKFLERNKFTELEKNEVAYHIHSLGATKKFWNIRGRGVNTVAIPEFKNKQSESLDTPEQNTKSPFA